MYGKLPTGESQARRARPALRRRKKEKEEEERVFIVFGHRVTASYLYSQPLSITPW
jgi:hypothetical protein